MSNGAMSSRLAWILVSLAVAACGGSDKPAATPDDRNVVQATIAPVPDAGLQEGASLPDTAERDRSRAEIERVARERDELEANTQGRASKDAAGPDPTGGKFSLADATAGLSGTGALTATIKTSQGDLRCRLFDTKAPNTVANFVGLARGTRAWKDPASGQWVTRPAYDGTTFHRIIKGFMIQGGDPKGDGTGEPGYVIKDEIWPGAKHDRAGLLCMANRGHDTNGAQFFITDTKVPHLDGNYTIFGECSPVSVVHAIAGVPVASPSSRPLSPVTIASVEITRGASKPSAPAKP